MKAISKGDFYASTGVELDKYKVDGKEITVAIKTHDRFKTKYRVEFIGKNGRVFQDNAANPATYVIKGDELYIRARISDSNGGMAWTQPVFVH